eukprot:8780970-Alexandrium_andersonii.AAC.1
METAIDVNIYLRPAIRRSAFRAPLGHWRHWRARAHVDLISNHLQPESPRRATLLLAMPSDKRSHERARTLLQWGYCEEHRGAAR